MTEATSGPQGFDQPEDAALASYPPICKARVIRVERINDEHVVVLIDTEPSHPMNIHCQLRGNLWYEAWSVSG